MRWSARVAERVRHPIFARLYARFSPGADRSLGIGEHRRELLEGVAGRVIEVGCGNGLNFARYPATVTEVLAVEPEPYMRARAIEAAQRAPVPVRVEAADASALPVADASFDVAVASLMLCSVSDQAGTLAEMYRVVRPGGELRFYEHVISERSKQRAVQRVADTVWPYFGGGCHTSRDTVAAIERAGFTIEHLRRYDMPGLLAYPASPHVIGRARR